MPEQRSLPTWRVPGYLDTQAGHLTVDSVDTARLADQYGTPLYVFSEKRITDNIRNLRRAVESVHARAKICYASKANSNMAVLDAVRRAGGDVEVNSGGELFKATTIGFRPDQIVFNGVSKTDDEIRSAIDYGILAINIDSLFELDQVTRVARSIGKRANVAIRIVPEIITRSHIGLQTGLLSSKFGLSPSQIDEARGTTWARRSDQPRGRPYPRRDHRHRTRSRLQSRLQRCGFWSASAREPGIA
jgi:diaminopimelate decarboxylase